MIAASIHAWKAHEDGEHMCPCDFEDPAAIRFDVRYAGAYCGMPLNFDSKYIAEQVCHALIRCYEAGKEAKLAELRRFIGV